MNDNYLEKYVSQCVESDIIDRFLERVLYDNDTTLESVITDYIEAHLEDILNEASDGIPAEDCFSDDVGETTIYNTLNRSLNEIELRESIKNPYRGESDWERNPNLK